MKLIGGIVLVIIVIVGGWFIFSPGQKAPTTTENQGIAVGEPNPSGTMPMNPQAENVTITYTDEGFSPASVTIPAGATVTWKNGSTKNMWVASAMHPSHTTYDGTSKDEHCANNTPTSATVFDECTGHTSGATWSFTFTKAGDWKYHDHITSGRYGSVTVTEAPVGVQQDGDLKAI